MVRERLHDFIIETGIKTGGRGLFLLSSPPIQDAISKQA
jgi:hypothetical protein